LEETGPKEHNWLGVEVDTWPVREIFHGNYYKQMGTSEIIACHIS